VADLKKGFHKKCQLKFPTSFDCYEGKEPVDVGLAIVAGARVAEDVDCTVTPRRSAGSGYFRLCYCFTSC
jgi:hypothetical protein